MDKQPCADHDRQSGEGAIPQEYTLIKMKIIHGETPFTQKNGDVLAEFKDDDVFCVAGTLRPETMYGQTNCFAFPNGDYVCVRMKNVKN